VWKRADRSRSFPRRAKESRRPQLALAALGPSLVPRFSVSMVIAGFLHPPAYALFGGDFPNRRAPPSAARRAGRLHGGVRVTRPLDFRPRPAVSTEFFPMERGEILDGWERVAGPLPPEARVRLWVEPRCCSTDEGKPDAPRDHTPRSQGPADEPPHAVGDRRHPVSRLQAPVPRRRDKPPPLEDRPPSDETDDPQARAFARRWLRPVDVTRTIG